MGSRHCDDKGKDIINECVEGFVHECSPWEVGDCLQLVVQKELWQHEEESKGIDTIDTAVDEPRVPAAGKEGGA